MKVEFLKAAEADFDEVVDFANYVFSHDGISLSCKGKWKDKGFSRGISDGA